KAVVGDFRHGAIHGGAMGHADLKQIRDVFHAPVPETALLLGPERRRVPVLFGDHPAFESLRLTRAAEPVDGSVAHRAMAEAFDQVRAPAPLRRLPSSAE